MEPADNYMYYTNNKWKSPKWYFAGLMSHKNLKSFIMKFSTCLQIQYKAIVKIWSIFISSQNIAVLWFNMFKRVIKIYLALRGTFVLKYGSCVWAPQGMIRQQEIKKGLKGAASIPTDDLFPPIRRSRNHHSLSFQTQLQDIYKDSFSSPTIRYWNTLPNSRGLCS